MKIINSWNRNESSIVANKIAEIFTSIEAVTQVELWSEDNFPFIEIVASRVIQPSEVIAWGAMLGTAVQAEIYFHSLRPYATTFLLKSDLLRAELEDFDLDRTDDYGTPLVEIVEAWSTDAGLNRMD